MCDFSHTSLTEEFRTARKEHNCYECGNPIEKGERYHYYAGLSDGDFFAHKAHLSCEQYLKEYGQEDGCWIAGTMLESMYEADAFPGLHEVGGESSDWPDDPLMEGTWVMGGWEPR